MSRSDFDTFIRRQQANDDTGAIDVEQELRTWREHLDQLYTDVRRYMASYLTAGTAQIMMQPVELNEEFSGPYGVEQMTLTIGRSTVLFKPVGTMLIGARGRVDVLGPRANARIGLVAAGITRPSQLVHTTISVGTRPPEPVRPPRYDQWRWKIITPPPRVEFIDLDEDAFFDLVLNVADA